MISNGTPEEFNPKHDVIAPGAFDSQDGKVVPFKDRPGGNTLGEATIHVKDDEIGIDVKLNQSDEAVALLRSMLGAEVIAEYENKPEYILIAAVREDPHAFDGMWYPTALSEAGIEMLQNSDPARFEEENLFFIHVSTDVDGLV